MTSVACEKLRSFAFHGGFEAHRTFVLPDISARQAFAMSRSAFVATVMHNGHNMWDRGSAEALYGLLHPHTSLRVQCISHSQEPRLGHPARAVTKWVCDTDFVPGRTTFAELIANITINHWIVEDMLVLVEPEDLVQWTPKFAVPLMFSRGSGDWELQPIQNMVPAQSFSDALPTKRFDTIKLVFFEDNVVDVLFEKFKLAWSRLRNVQLPVKVREFKLGFVLSDWPNLKMEARVREGDTVFEVFDTALAAARMGHIAIADGKYRVFNFGRNNKNAVALGATDVFDQELIHQLRFKGHTLKAVRVFRHG